MAEQTLEFYEDHDKPMGTATLGDDGKWSVEGKDHRCEKFIRQTLAHHYTRLTDRGKGEPTPARLLHEVAAQMPEGKRTWVKLAGSDANGSEGE